MFRFHFQLRYSGRRSDSAVRPSGEAWRSASVLRFGAEIRGDEVEEIVYIRALWHGCCGLYILPPREEGSGDLAQFRIEC